MNTDVGSQGNEPPQPVIGCPFQLFPFHFNASGVVGFPPNAHPSPELNMKMLITSADDTAAGAAFARCHLTPSQWINEMLLSAVL
jgi:hypothetical protein